MIDNHPAVEDVKRLLMLLDIDPNLVLRDNFAPQLRLEAGEWKLDLTVRVSPDVMTLWLRKPE